MDCKTAANLIELCVPAEEAGGPPERADIAEHLEECPTCLERFRACQAAEPRIARSMQSVPVPAGLRERILTHLAAAPVPLERRRLVRRVLFPAAAAIVAVVAGSLLFWTSRRQPDVVRISARGLGEQARAVTLENELWVPAAQAGEVVPWCIRQLAMLRLDATPPQTSRLVGLSGIARANLDNWWVAVFRYIDPRGPHNGLASNADVFACPRDRFLVPGLSATPVRVSDETQGQLVFAWVEGDTIYVAVLKGWPGPWEPRGHPERANELI